LRISRLGRSSITYDLAIFREADGALELSATGVFVHVYVDAETRKPVEIPEVIRTAAAALVTD
jgi:acyl-CoA thioester hydrolase